MFGATGFGVDLFRLAVRLLLGALLLRAAA